MIKCLCLCGLLKSSTTLKNAIRLSLKSWVHDEALAEYLDQELVATAHAVPSRTVLYRHRLMLSIGFCRFLQDKNAELLAMDGGVVRWSTCDGSPVAGWDWLLYGHVTLPVVVLLETFKDASAYVTGVRTWRTLQASLQQGEGREADLEELSSDLEELRRSLAPKLKLQLNMPTGVGSGRADIRYKTHAAVHSERLTAPSWRGACELLSSTFTNTGDLGTESHFQSVRVELSTLFGEWTNKAADDFDLDGADEAEFEFEPEVGDEAADNGADGDGFDFEFQVRR